jgi:alkanesulfonate monooxygenase SsuD/methylene tetrahydromethanopterin reductase-like flavin-dependent oxidoreductase (luciferase family)
MARAATALAATTELHVGLAAALPDAWVDRLAIVGTPGTARERVRALHRSGADRVVLIPAYPELLPALDSLARVL